MAINVVRYGNATKPVMASEKESTNPVGQVINALGSAFETGNKFYDRVETRKEKDAEAKRREEEKKAFERQKIIDAEEKTAALQDLSILSRDVQEEIERNRVAGYTDGSKRTADFAKKRLEKALKEKPLAYREVFNEGYNKIITEQLGKSVNFDLENSQFKTLDSLQNAVDLTSETVGTNFFSVKESAKGLSDIVSDLPIPEHLKPSMQQQVNRKLYGSSIEKLTAENPVVARSLIENDEEIASVFSEKERYEMLRDCDEAAFNNLASKDVVALNDLMNDEKAAKEAFPTLNNNDLNIFKNKAAKLKSNYDKQVEAARKMNISNRYTAFMKNPNYNEFKNIEESGDYNQKQIEEAKERLDFVQQEDVNTLNNEFIPALNENLKAWAKVDPDSPEAKTELMNQVSNAIYQMGVYNNKGILSANDMNSYTQKITDIFSGDFYREFQEARPYMEKHINQAIELNKMQHLKFGDDLYLGDIFQTTFLSKAEREKRLMKTVNYTAQAFLEYIARGEMDNALKVIADGEDRAFKAWYPEYANLNEGDSVIVKGMVMKYKGRNGLIPIIEVD